MNGFQDPAQLMKFFLMCRGMLHGVLMEMNLHTIYDLHVVFNACRIKMTSVLQNERVHFGWLTNYFQSFFATDIQPDMLQEIWEWSLQSSSAVSLADGGRRLRTVLPCRGLWITRAMEVDDAADPILLAYRFFGKLAALVQDCLAAADKAAQNAHLTGQVPSGSFPGAASAVAAAAAPDTEQHRQDQVQQSSLQHLGASDQHFMPGSLASQSNPAGSSCSESEVGPATNRYNELEFQFGSRLSRYCREAYWRGQHIVVKSAPKLRCKLEHEVMLLLSIQEGPTYSAILSSSVSPNKW